MVGADKRLCVYYMVNVLSTQISLKSMGGDAVGSPQKIPADSKLKTDLDAKLKKQITDFRTMNNNDDELDKMFNDIVFAEDKSQNIALSEPEFTKDSEKTFVEKHPALENHNYVFLCDVDALENVFMESKTLNSTDVSEIKDKFSPNADTFLHQL